MSLNSSDPVNRQDTTIASGATNGAAIELGGLSPRGIGVLTPAEWTAADIYIDVSVDGETFYPLYDQYGSRVTISGIASAEARLYVAPASAWVVGVWPYMRLVSSSAQGAARTLTVIILR